MMNYILDHIITEQPLRRSPSPVDAVYEQLFQEDSMVEVHIHGQPMYGVIRWIGKVPGIGYETIAGLELVGYTFFISELAILV